MAAVQDAASAVQATANVIIDVLSLPPPQPARVSTDVCGSDRAIDLLIAFEIGTPALYTRKYQAPVWPGGASGATIGIGYDLGYQHANVIAMDWEAHPHHVRLQSAAGITGVLARDKIRELADITVEYGLARKVFDQTSVIEHGRLARRAFGAQHYDAIHPNTRGALCSLVFNRGSAMTGKNREEMRAIRDECLPRRDRACVAAQLRAMVRIWVGGSIEKGMRNRREAEAVLAEAA